MLDCDIHLSERLLQEAISSRFADWPRLSAAGKVLAILTSMFVLGFAECLIFVPFTCNVRVQRVETKESAITMARHDVQLARPWQSSKPFVLRSGVFKFTPQADFGQLQLGQRHWSRLPTFVRKFVQPVASASSDETHPTDATDSVVVNATDGRVLAANSSLSAPVAALKSLRRNLFGNGGFRKDRIASMGATFAVSYGLISNMNFIPMWLLAWVTFGKSTGLSPLAKGQWPAFLGVYGAIYATVGSITRPFRFALAGAAAPIFDKLINIIREKLRLSKPAAVGVCVFCNACITLLTFATGLRLVTWIFRVPLFAASA